MKNEESSLRQPLLGNADAEHGQKHEYDANFKGVKETGRKFNDIIFGLLFLIVIAGMIFVSIIGFTKVRFRVDVSNSIFIFIRSRYSMRISHVITFSHQIFTYFCIASHL